MATVNATLLQLAQHRVWKDSREKQAATPPMGGDPAMGGMPPGGGGMPPGGGGAPPMDPAMMGGAPPMDPAMMGGGMAPPAAPAAPAAPAMPGQDPAMMGGMGMQPPKLKPEQMMQMLDFRLYNMQQQITAMMNAQGISLPPGALVTPPGSPTPVAEAAVPGGPNDPGQPATGGGDPAAGGGGGGNSAIGPIDAIQGASPALAGGGGGGGDGSMKSASFRDLMYKLATVDDGEPVVVGIEYADYDGDANNAAHVKAASLGQPFPAQFFTGSPTTNAAALAAILRQRTQQVG